MCDKPWLPKRSTPHRGIQETLGFLSWGTWILGEEIDGVLGGEVVLHYGEGLGLGVVLGETSPASSPWIISADIVVAVGLSAFPQLTNLQSSVLPFVNTK